MYNTKSELQGKLQALGDDVSMQVHQRYHMSHSGGGGVGNAVSRGGWTWWGEADRGYTRLCFPLNFTMNLKLFQKNKINFKTFKPRMGMFMYTHSLLLPFFF